jgi:CHAD domain-containing protein
MVEPGVIFEHLHSEFFAALEACRVRPRPKAVHQLRTTARRLEALLNAAKRRQPNNAKFGRQVDKALKALKPIRQAAGPVRDIDVQMGLLEDFLRASINELPPAEFNVVKQEATKVQARLEKHRKRAARELTAAVTDVDDALVKRISHLQTELSTEKWMSVLKDARSVERDSATSLDIADPDSLHAYRKSSKSARYLAEMEEGSAAARQFAKEMKKVLDAIGAWHDWMLLTQLAKKTIGKSSALAKVLKKERDGALRRAARAVERLHRKT